MSSSFDVIVVGMGHAGCEASLAAARMGLSVAAVTLRADRIAVMSCNPAIGGTAKGHLVKELDALGGQMGRVADLSGTHFQVLNRSKGPAVQASRVLCHREEYARVMQGVVASQERLSVVEGEVSEVLAEDGRVFGVRLASGLELRAKAVVLTTGTFLQALMHVGEKKEVGGRLGDESAQGLSASLKSLGLQMGRFKTGTPARLSRKTIDFSKCELQPGDDRPKPFSLQTRPEAEVFPRLSQVHCHITYTNGAAHDVIRQNLSRSPLFQGEIAGRGPRYCPSLEDKVVRFADRPRHQVFLEPEGPTSDLVYPAGLSTSLPADVQEKFLRHIPGLEEVVIVRYGYAVEYDYVPPTQLLPTLEARQVKGLFLAGQLNGTSGYEEAAFQGLWAGVNASLGILGKPPMVLGRHEAHGAVLVDELVSKGVDEPFRMLTSRSEHRLRLREGNADVRLRHHGHRVGLVSDQALEATRHKASWVQAEIARIKKAGLDSRLRRPEESYASLAAVDGARPAGVPEAFGLEVEIEVKYEGYIAHAEKQWARSITEQDAWAIPEGLAFADVRGLSAEVLEKLRQHQPRTVGQAKRIPGMTPASLSLLCIHLKRLQDARGVDSLNSSCG